MAQPGVPEGIVSDDLARHFGLAGAVTLRTVDRADTNNCVFAVHAAGHRYVAKAFQTQAGAESSLYEHALLRFLTACDLPFATPAPQVASDGSTLWSSPAGQLALYAWLPGEPARPALSWHASQVGEGLALLDP